MVTTIDDAVADIVSALDEVGMLDNTVIVFSSDNGGQPNAGGANNYPLRGAKNTWWEGGIRVPSWIYSPLFDDTIAGTTSDWYYRLPKLFFIFSKSL